MIRKTLPVLLLLAIMLACSKSSRAKATTADFVEFTRAAVLGAVRVGAQVARITAVIQGEAPPPYVQVVPSEDPDDPPFTYEFTIELDTQGDVRADTGLTGKATFSQDPSEGIAVGSTMDYNCTIQPLQDASTILVGTCNSLVTFTTANAITWDLGLDLTNRLTASTATFNRVDGSSLVIVFGENIIGVDGPMLAAEILGLQVEGTLMSRVTLTGQEFTGALDLALGSQDLLFSGVLNSVEFDDSVRLFPSDDEIQQLLERAYDQQSLFLEMSGLMEDLTELFIAGGRELSGLPPHLGLTVTPASSTVSNYTMNLSLFTGGQLSGTMTGQLSVYSDHVTPDGRVTTFQASYDVDAQTQGGLRFTGRSDSTIPLRARIGIHDTYVYWGKGSIDLAASPACTTRFAVPETGPLVPDAAPLRDGPHTEGVNEVAVDIDPDTLTAQLLYTPEGSFPLFVTVDGIPIPSEVFLPD